MRNKFPTGALALALALILTCGAALAQAPDVQRERPGQKQRGDRPQLQRQAPADGGVGKLIAMGGNVTVTNIDNGVELAITVEKPELVQALQQRLAKSVERLEKVREKMGQMGVGMKGHDVPGLWGMILKGKLTLSVDNLDKGAVLTLTSDDAEIVKTLQTEMPGWIEAATAIRTQLAARMKMTQLISEGKVTIEIIENENGVSVKFTSNDAKTLKMLERIMPAYIEGLKNPAAAPMKKGKRARPGGGKGKGKANKGEPAERAFPEPADK